MTKAQIEMRFPDCGFVYTKQTRMLFAPKRTSTRKQEDKESTDMVLCSADKWPEPTKQDVAEVRAVLVATYPDRKLFADTAEGLVLIYEPA